MVNFISRVRPYTILASEKRSRRLLTQFSLAFDPAHEPRQAVDVGLGG